MKHKTLLLLLFFSSDLLASARDPFMPPAHEPCLRSIPSLASWRLKGVIGDGSRFVAWLREGEQPIVIAQPTRFLPLTPWRVEAITAGTVSLSVPTSCGPQLAELYLKGK